MAKWIKSETHLYASSKRLTSAVRTHRSKVNLQEKIFHSNETQRKLVTRFISEKIDYNTSTIIRHKYEHYIRIKESIK